MGQLAPNDAQIGLAFLAQSLSKNGIRKNYNVDMHVIRAGGGKSRIMFAMLKMISED